MTKLENATRARRAPLGLVGLAVVLLAPGLASASDFDGSRNLLCAPTDAVQCEGAGECSRKEVELLNMSKFLYVDFAGKKLSGSVEGAEDEKASTIQNFQKLESTTLVQGAEEGRGWSLTVDQVSGDMTLAIAGDDLAFVLFGVCQPR